MKRTRRLLALVLGVLLLIPGTPLILPAGAAAATAASDTPVPPAGYHLTGRTFDDETYGTLYYVSTESSPEGWVDGYWMTADGKRADKRALPTDYDEETANARSADLPAAYDARSDGLITPVENQIGGTCWAHAAVACMEANAIKQGLADANGIDFSEYHMPWFIRNGRYENESSSANDGVNQDRDEILSGGNYDDVEQAVYNFNGPVYEARFPFVSTEEEDLLDEMESTFTFADRYLYDYVCTHVVLVGDTVEAIKAGVLKYGAVQTSYWNDYNYSFPTDTETGERLCTFFKPNSDHTTHAVTVVGWDDNFSRDYFTLANRKPSADGAFLIKNSWGSDWGYMGGYFWLSYENIHASSVAYEVAPRADFENVYLYDGLGCSANTGGTGSANIFTVGGDEYLTKVSLGKATNEYTFSIYRDLPENAASPVEGTLVYTQSGNAHGERWIDVTGDVPFASGDRFSVVFTGLSRVYVESINGSAAYQSNPGESFYCTGTVWHDAHAGGYHNVAVRAATKSVSEGPYTVTYTCPGFYSQRVEAVNGAAALPQTEGHTWVLTYNGAPFNGTGVYRDMTVEAHCYPTAGQISNENPCTTEYRCIYCGEEKAASAVEHSFTDSLTAPTATCPGYRTRVCGVCGETVWDEYTFDAGASASGTFGGFGWQIVNGVLGVVGRGALPDLEANEAAPWAAYAGEITALVVNDGVTAVGAHDFAGLTAMTEMDLCATLTAIGQYAFDGDTALKAFTAPVNLVSIGSYAFRNTTSLASVDFVGQVRDFGKQVFSNCALTEAVIPGSFVTGSEEYIYYNCSQLRKLTVEEGVTRINNRLCLCNNLEELNLPASMTYIRPYVYSYGMLELKRVNVAPENADYCSVDGVMYNKAMTTLCFHPAGNPGDVFTVGENVTALTSYAFSNCWSVEYLDMSGCGVTTLTSSALYYMQWLKYINLPVGLTSIGSNALYGSNAAKIYIPSTVTTIQESAFNTPRVTPTIYTDSETSAAKAYADAHGYPCVVLEGHTHDYSTALNTVAPSCAAPGAELAVCECGCFRTTILPKNENHQKNSSITVAPTCTDDGRVYYVCTVCGREITEQVLPASGHTWEWIVDTPATCEQTGVRHEECTVCHEKRNTGDVIPQGEHSFTAQTVSEDALRSAATCSAPAAYYYSCAVCGAVEHNDAHLFTVGSVAGHTWEWVVDTPADCGNAGVKHEECAVCHVKRNENTQIPASGEHSFTAETVSEDALRSAATCSAPAAYYYSCAVCGAVEHNDAHLFTVGSVAGHTWEWVVDTPADCGNAGVKHEECAVCHVKRNENTEIPASGEHSWIWVIDRQATCTSVGQKHEACTVCRMSKRGVEIPMADHALQTVPAKAATCTAAGNSAYRVCGTCGGFFAADSLTPIEKDSWVIPAAGHRTSYVAAKSPTCTAAGNTAYWQCADCGARFAEETAQTALSAADVTLAKLPHSFTKSGRQAPTCTAEGWVEYTCQNGCGEVKREKLAKTAHTDADGDGICDDCKTDLTPNRCKYCNEVHTGFLGKIIQIFHNLLYLLKNLFKK